MLCDKGVSLLPLQGSRKMEKKSLDLIQFIVGIILALTWAILMFLGILPIIC